ncbi:MAG: hypothetical protein Q4P66_07610 [Actinomycetaceae bacterium]|nr:hypothetical protein [Actinomycetaceae bacterium]
MPRFEKTSGKSHTAATPQHPRRHLLTILGALVLCSILAASLTSAPFTSLTYASELPSTAQGSSHNNTANTDSHHSWGTSDLTVSTTHRTKASTPTPTVFIGVSGLRWQDINLDASDNAPMKQLAEKSMIANTVVRSQASISCPADGWLTLSAGMRHIDKQARATKKCRPIEEPHDFMNPETPTAPAIDAVVPHWKSYRESVSQNSPAISTGNLGSSLADASRPYAVIGPGAAIGFARHDGVVPAYYHLPHADSDYGRAVEKALDKHSFVAVDAGNVRSPHDITFPSTNLVVNPDDGFPGADPLSAIRNGQVPTNLADKDLVKSYHPEPLLRRINAIIKAVDSRADIMIVSLGDTSHIAHLQMALIEDSSYPASAGTLARSISVKQNGIIQTTDITELILHRLDIQNGSDTGSNSIESAHVNPSTNSKPDTSTSDTLPITHKAPISAVGPPGTPLKARYNALVSRALHSDVTQAIFPDYFIAITITTVASLFIIIALSMTPLSTWFYGRKRLLRILSGVLLWAAAIPFATHICTFIPVWMIWPSSRSASLWITLILIGALSSILSLVSSMIDRLFAMKFSNWHTRWNPLGAVSWLSAAYYIALVVSPLLGSIDQLDALLGTRTAHGLRFYGVGNSQFALLIVATMICAGVAAFIFRGRRIHSLFAVGVIGAIAVFIDGFPTLGVDFGGPPALVPGICLLVIMLVLHTKVNWKNLAATLGITILVIAFFGIVTLTMPSMRTTHIGKFYSDLLHHQHGNAVIQRKAGAAIDTIIGSTVNLVSALAGITAIIVLLWWCSKRFRPPLTPSAHMPWRAGKDVHILYPIALSTATACIIGVFINDSGILILATALVYAIPAYGASLVSAMSRLEK